MKSGKRRELLLATLAATATRMLPFAASARRSVVPTLASKNSYAQANFATSKASYGAAFTFNDMVDAWGIAIRPAGAGRHFWVTAGGKSHQFIGDVTASATPSLRTMFQDGLAEMNVPGELRDAANPGAGNKAQPGEPVPFNIHVLNGRVFVMYCVSQVLRNEAGFIVDAGQFFASEEDSLDAAGEDKAGGFPNRGKLVEYTMAGELVRVFDDLGRLNAPWGVAIARRNLACIPTACWSAILAAQARLPCSIKTRGASSTFCAIPMEM